VSTTIQKKNISFLLLRLWPHLSQRRRFQFWLLLGLMLISAFVEVISLGAVLPFLGILIVPDKIFNHPFVHNWVSGLGITSAQELVLPLTVLFGVGALMAGIFRMLLLWVSTRMAFACGADLSIEVYRRTLYQPYKVHADRNSSEVISSITLKINIVVFEVLLPFLLLISSLVLSVVITVALFAIDPMVAAYTILIFGTCYGLITWFTQQRLKINGQRIAQEQTQVVKALQEGLGGIRDVLLEGAQSVYCDVYRKADCPLRWAQGNNIFVSNCPRYALESLGMILLTVLAYILSHKPGGLAESVPMLGALAIGAQRILPALQQSYGTWARITGSHASLADVQELLDQPVSDESLQPDPEPLDFQDSIKFKGVNFRYNLEGAWVLDGLNLNIPKGSRVGFVGRTGSGKSTALDILMGLLRPVEGEILVDDQPVKGRKARAWQRTIAHVPQSIYLSDNTLAENIAFGIPRESIDMGRVRQAAQQAQIAGFIESTDEGYDVLVGERGVRLSGGQRQRIGIARSLYKQASVLVFDEATSALDNETEKEVMSSIDGLDRDLTILIIAHRISTVRHCDTIIELDQGQIVAQGTFEQLIERSPSFRKMAKTVEDGKIK
jgi:ATP-binding cassette, subfamily B, bacterial PglK